VIVRRWQKYTGKMATLGHTGRTFEDIEAERVLPEKNGDGAIVAPEWKGARP
jgi:hypothetical protein